VTIAIPRDDDDKPTAAVLAKKVLKSGKAWFGQIKAPFVKDPLSPKIPPTPKTADWANNTWANEAPLYSASRFAYQKKKVDIGHKRQASDESERKQDPPPLYTKHPDEGGRKAWMSVAGAFLVQFCIIGYLFTWNTFEDYYTHHSLTDQNPIAIRFIGDFQWFLTFFLGLVGGKLADVGYFTHVVVGGSVFYTCCLFLLSVVGEGRFGLVFACQSIGMGIGMGLLFAPTVTLPTRYFTRTKGLTIGIAMSGGPFGGVILPAILRTTMHSRGFGASIRITAFLIAPLLIIGCFLMMNPPVEPKPELPVPRLDLAKYSREWEYIAAAGGMFIALLFICYPAWYLELIGLENDNIHFMAARTTITVLSLGGIIGSISFGFASDKLGVWNIFTIVNVFLMILMSSMHTIRNTPSLMAFSFFYGIFLASWFSLGVTALASLATRPRETGTRVGLVLTIASFACLFASLIQNAALGPDLKWGRASAISGMFILVVTGLAVFSRMTYAEKLVGRKKKFIRGIQYLQVV
jgi:MFS family permease